MLKERGNMRKFLAIIILLISACSNDTSNAPNLVSVTYRDSSGTVSPKYAWNEQYSVTSAGLSFERTATVSPTSVNTGSWVINSFGSNETKLFKDLSGMAVYSVSKTGQGVTPTGGGIKTYELRYDNGDRREVVIGDGSSYSNVELISTPIDNFISKISLPHIASKRFQSVQQGGALQGNPLTLTAVVSTLAGSVEGASDGIGTAAAFRSPYGLTTDGANLYVADRDNHLIRKIVIATREVSTIAGNGFCGSADGNGTSASFCGPSGITTDGTNLYVTDTQNSSIRKINISTKDVTTLAGQAGWAGADDATGNAARFLLPYGITTDGFNLYVADTYNNTIRKIIIESGVVTTLAGAAGVSGSIDGAGANAHFNRPAALTTDGSYLYVADTDNYTVRKIVISSGEVTTLAGTALNFGTADGVGAAATFWTIGGIITDGTNLFVTDTPNGTVRKIVISSAQVTTLAGNNSCIGTNDGVGVGACFNYPRGITSDGDYLYINDNNGNLVRKME